MPIKTPSLKIPSGIKKVPIYLYGITGWFMVPEHEIGCAAFGGYFKYDPNDNSLGSGVLSDIFGESVIAGSMNKNELRFTKIYENRHDNIEYEFKKQNGIWVGNFSYGVDIDSGKAKCITTLISKDAFVIATGGDPRKFEMQEQSLIKRYGG